MNVFIAILCVMGVMVVSCQKKTPHRNVSDGDSSSVVDQESDHVSSSSSAHKPKAQTSSSNASMSVPSAVMDSSNLSNQAIYKASSTPQVVNLSRLNPLQRELADKKREHDSRQKQINDILSCNAALCKALIDYRLDCPLLGFITIREDYVAKCNQDARDHQRVLIDFKFAKDDDRLPREMEVEIKVHGSGKEFVAKLDGSDGDWYKELDFKEKKTRSPNHDDRFMDISDITLRSTSGPFPGNRYIFKVYVMLKVNTTFLFGENEKMAQPTEVSPTEWKIPFQKAFDDWKKESACKPDVSEVLKSCGAGSEGS